MFIEITYNKYQSTHRAIINTDNICSFSEERANNALIIMNNGERYEVDSPLYEELLALLLNPVTVTSGYSVPEWFYTGPSAPLPGGKE